MRQLFDLWRQSAMRDRSRVLCAKSELFQVQDFGPARFEVLASPIYQSIKFP